MRLSQDHEAYRDQVRRFMEGVVRPLSAEFDLTRPLSRAEVDALHARLRPHAIGADEPVLDDGTPDLVACGIFTEELNRIDASLGAMASALFFSPLSIRDLLDEGQLERFGHLFEPGRLVAVGLSEPNVGSNPAAVETKAIRDGDGWTINGTKLWTSNATISDAILVTCRDEEAASGLSLFLVDRQTYAYDPRPIPCLGMTGISTCEVAFVDCWVPAIAQLGADGSGLGQMLGLVERARVNIAFTAVGIAQAALDAAVLYAKGRTQFGRPIASFQLVQELLSDMATEVSASRLLGLHAATLLQAHQPCRSEVSMAKAYCTEMAVRVTSMGIQVHGGMGLTKECDAERYFRDARMQTIPDGTTQIHKLIIGRELVGISALT